MFAFTAFATISAKASYLYASRSVAYYAGIFAVFAFMCAGTIAYAQGNDYQIMSIVLNSASIQPSALLFISVELAFLNTRIYITDPDYKDDSEIEMNPYKNTSSFVFYDYIFMGL